MKILFLAHHKWPHVGGVEKHAQKISEILTKKKDKVTIIAGEDIEYPHIKFFGLLYIWYWLLKNIKLIKNSDIVHIHDVFIWYLPFRFFFPFKKVVTTFHGWEGIWPIPWKNIFLKRLASILSDGNIAVGKYIEKYYGIKADKITYGASNATVLGITVAKVKNTIVFVGRLDKDTGLLKFLEWLDNNPKHKIDFCGDGSLRKECEKYGTVHGFTDPTPFLKKAEYCVPGGYLAALEGLAANCKLKLFWNNKVKEDYWKMSPFYKLKGEVLKKWAKEQIWDKLAGEYINLYKSLGQHNK